MSADEGSVTRSRSQPRVEKPFAYSHKGGMTGPSRELVEALDGARRRLALSPDGHLILGSRQRIWAAMGPRLRDGNRAIPGVGLLRRTALASACVGRVLPLWEQRLPQDRSPHALLGLIVRYLRGAADYESLREEAHELWALADHLCYAAEGNQTSVFMDRGRGGLAVGWSRPRGGDRSLPGVDLADRLQFPLR
jgi:hypothetical protein